MKVRLSIVLNLSAHLENVRRNEHTLPRILKLSTKLEARDLLHEMAALSREVELPDIHDIGGWVSARICLDPMEKREIGYSGIRDSNFLSSCPSIFPEFRLMENVGEEVCAYAIFAGECEGQGATSTTLAQMGNTNMDFKIVWCGGVDEDCLA
jgi:hypothetical protein